MSDHNQEEIETVVRAFYSTIRRVGYKKVLNTLSKLKDISKSDNYELNLQNWIIAVVCKMYDCEYTDLQKNHIKGLFFQARTMCFIMLNEHTKLSQQFISNLFSYKNRTVISHAKKYKSSLSPKVKEDVEFLDRYDTINDQIIKYKQSNKPSTDVHNI